jgi:hypothetical protein
LVVVVGLQCRRKRGKHENGSGGVTADVRAVQVVGLQLALQQPAAVEWMVALVQVVSMMVMACSSTELASGHGWTARQRSRHAQRVQKAAVAHCIMMSHLALVACRMQQWQHPMVV